MPMHGIAGTGGAEAWVGRDREGAHDGTGKGEKERALENDTGQEYNKLNGNKINETGFKPDWERTTIGTR